MGRCFCDVDEGEYMWGDEGLRGEEVLGVLIWLVLWFGLYLKLIEGG